MRRTALLALLLPLLLALPASATSTVLEPTRPGNGGAAVLVLLPDAGTDPSALLGVARAAQSATDLRLWVGIAASGATAADAELSYRSLLAEVRDRGFRQVADADVVVAGWGRGAAGAVSLGRSHALAGTVALGAADGPVDLRVLAELDRSVPVVATVAGEDAVLVEPGTATLHHAAVGQAVAALVEARRGAPEALDARLAADPLVAAVRDAARLQAGEVCADLQHRTADLAPADAGRISVVNHADTELVSPTPDGVLASDLGGFLYGKASLVDDGSTARLTTTSYVVPSAGPVATEVMCKTKSRSAVAQALHDDFRLVDGTAPTCAEATRATLDAALAVLSPAAQQRSGGVTVLPDQATSAGPQWVFTPMTVRPADPLTGRWEVQSPSLVTELDDTQLDPEFAGNHYCKALSPLRALQLLLEETAPAG